MKADIIAVGSREKYDSFFLASCNYIKNELASLKCEIGEYTVLEGDSRQLYELLKSSAARSDMIFILQSPEPEAARAVAEVCAAGLGMGVISDPALLSQLAAHAAKAGLQLDKTQLEAFLLRPSSATPIPNQAGLAQGWCISAQKQLMMALPAAPSEVAALFSAHVRSIVSAFSGNTSRSFGVARVLDLDDESVATRLQGFAGKQNPKVTWTNNEGDCEIYVEATGATAEEAERLRGQTMDSLKNTFGVYYYGEGYENLQQAVVHRLADLKKTVATAESCTGGLLSERITEVSGSSRVFEFGLSAYANRVKIEKLDVPRSFIRDYGAISRRTAAAMAVGARKKGKADIGIGITGNAGPTADEDKPVGLVYVAMADSRSVWVKKLLIQQPGASRDYIRNIAVLQALNMLRLYVMSYPDTLAGATPISKVMKPTAILMDKLRLDRTGDTALPAQYQTEDAAPEYTTPKSDKAYSAAPAHVRARQIPKEKEMIAMNVQDNGPQGGAVARTNLIQRIKNRQLTKNDKIRMGVLALCLIVFVVCIAYIVSVKMESVNTEKLTNSLLDKFEDAEQISRDDLDGYPDNYLDMFTNLYAENPDIAGFLEIEGTKVKYPIVQTVDNDFYHRRDFYGETNQHGIPYVDYRVDQALPSANTIIYGHNMGDGQMFGELIQYKTIAYYRQHPLIRYDSVYRTGVYKIFAIVVCKANDEEFLYHNNINMNAEELTAYVKDIRQRSIFNTTVDVTDTDTLLTLSTCDYSFKDESGKQIARFVVFARRVRDGESTDVDTNGATINTNPLMPEEWYAYIAKLQADALKAQQEKEEAEKLANAKNAWLTDEEKTNLSTEEQQTLIADRQAWAASTLTEDEISASMNITERIALMQSRDKLFNLYLSGEQNTLTDVSQKLKLAEEYKAFVRLFMSEEQVSKYTTYTELQAVMSTNNALLKLLLNNNEYANYSTEKKIDTFKSRYAEYKAYLTDQQILACSDYSQVTAARSAKETVYAKWMTAADMTSLKTAAERDAKVAERKAAIKALVDAGKLTQAQVDAFVNADQIDAAITAGGASEYDVWLSPQQKTQLKTDEEKKAAAGTRKAEYAKWLTDLNPTGYSSENENTLISRKKQATDIGMTSSDWAPLTTWSQINTWIGYKNQFSRWLTANERSAGTYTAKVNLMLERQAAIKNLVSSGKLTQAQADALDTPEKILAAIAAGSGKKVTALSFSGNMTIDPSAGALSGSATLLYDPADATKKEVSWSQPSLPAGVSVNTSHSGVTVSITQEAAAALTSDVSFTITATTTDGSNLSATCTVTIKAPAAPAAVKVTTITAAPSSITLSLSGTTSASFTLSVLPDNAEDKSVSYHVSAEGVISLSGGTVTAIGVGTATITITANDGSGVTATVTVTVTE